MEIYLEIIKLLFGKFCIYLIILKHHFCCNAYSQTEDAIFYIKKMAEQLIRVTERVTGIQNMCPRCDLSNQNLKS